MFASLALTIAALSCGADPRTAYDVQSYRLDLALDPRSRRIDGTLCLEAKLVSPATASLVLDLDPALELSAVERLEGALDGTRECRGVALPFRRDGRTLVAQLGKPGAPGERVLLALRYGGTPLEKSSFEGFHWKKSADGQPWIDVACPDSGSSSWFPCKDSYWHPEDMAERVWINLRVPAGLTGVANGRLIAKEEQGAWDLFRWELAYPCASSAIALHAGAFVHASRTLQVGGKPLACETWMLPEDAAKAELQFEDVPPLLEAFTEAFGEYPFPRAKFALVESSFLGLGHSSCIGYGSSFPAWCAREGVSDPHSEENELFDAVLVRECAREWWGNALGPRTWADAWIQEGFATYAEAVYAEKVLGPEVAQQFLEGLHVGANDKLLRPAQSDASVCSDAALGRKGAWVLHALRWQLDDDETWWKTLRAFHDQFRYRTASTADFREVLERQSGKKWERFFRAWIEGSGHPELRGRVAAEPARVVLEIENSGSDGTEFEVPLEITWRDGKDARRERVMLAPGKNELAFPCKSKPKGLQARGFEHVPGAHAIRIE
ncbi:MAG: M1 family metallopeptidase [Planctomycetes bacterium]|nr:M1 family metallopeptidase [Planctomycetota bacterium]